jgi:hypothetical protein
VKHFFKIFFLLFLCFGILANCRQKKVFKWVEIKGRLIRNSTQSPAENVELHLNADNKFLSKDYYDGSLELTSMTTNSDGTFKLKSRASRTDHYYLKAIYPTHGGALLMESTSVKENATTDLGDILVNY